MGKSEFSALVFDNQINQPPKLAPSVHCIKVKAPGIKFAMLTDEFFIQPGRCIVLTDIRATLSQFHECLQTISRSYGLHYSRSFRGKKGSSKDTQRDFKTNISSLAILDECTHLGTYRGILHESGIRGGWDQPCFELRRLSSAVLCDESGPLFAKFEAMLHARTKHGSCIACSHTHVIQIKSVINWHQF